MYGEESAPERAGDLRYGEAVYQFHLDEPLEALTRLEVAAERGGIAGHGQYPRLMKGGLMLSWGMMDSARDIFSLLLASDEEEAGISPRARNRAWLQLARQLYSGGRRVEARNALEQVEPLLLHQQDPQLYYEWHYLTGQIAISNGIGDLGRSLQVLSDQDSWWGYLKLNQAVRALAEGDRSLAKRALRQLLDQLPDSDGSGEPPQEPGYLRDQARLLLSELATGNGEYQRAIGLLEEVDADGVYGTQAHYEMAVIAVLAGEADRAKQGLAAVETAANAWLSRYPVEYAHGVIEEQQGNIRQAIASYDQAAERYQAWLAQLQAERAGITEDQLRQHLAFAEEDDFRFAELSNSSGFQRDLRRLDDLYGLRTHFRHWAQQLESFDTMLEARQAARDAQLRRAREVLGRSDSRQLTARYRELKDSIGQAIENGNALFFATDEQAALYRRIESARDLLAGLPEGEQRSAQQARLERVEAYFQWLIADQFGVNRWAAEKQLRELERALAELARQTGSLNQAITSDPENDRLRARVAEQRRAIGELQSELEQAVVIARQALMERVDEYYREQTGRLERYRIAARHGAARLADDYQQNNPALTAITSAIDHYRTLIPLLEDQERARTASYRLASLLLRQAEETGQPEPVSEAIAAHEELLDLYPDHAGNDQLWYQLARLHSLQGRVDQVLTSLSSLVSRYPDSALVAEAWFRMGDQHFLDGRYAEATEAFANTIDTASVQAGQLALRALYMLGWSQYREGNYPESLISYSAVLDETWPAEQGGSESALLQGDTFRAMGLALSQLQRADSLQALFARIGSRPWEEEAYRRYATMLTEKEQFTEAVAVYDRFIEAHPESQQAPRFYGRILDVLETAGFTGTLLERKSGFVEQYGISGNYWALVASPETLGFLASRLERLLPELAGHYRQQADLAGADDAGRRDLERTADYYERFALTFPDHPDVAEILFALGELQLDLDQTPGAITTFERVAYLVPGADPDLSAEAGYAMVLAYRGMVRDQSAGEQAQADPELLMQQQRNRLRFAETFAADPRAPEVYYQALYREFGEGSFELAADMAVRLGQWSPAPSAEVKLDALVVEAHSYYELGNHERAEKAYQRALAVMPEQDERRGNLQANLAASVYRQGEARLNEGDLAGAVDDFLRISQLAPGSALAASARYDASGYLVELKDWGRAIPLLDSLRQEAELAQRRQTLTARLALAYRETEQWERAAGEVETLAEMATTPEERRRSLLEAAKLYDRGEANERAIVAYRSYANRYASPIKDYMSAAHRLAELYRASGEELKRNFWLERQARRVEQSPDQAGERERRWAAESANELAGQALHSYRRIELTLPLTESMVAKTDALEKAVQAYQRAAGFGVGEISTEAGFRIADIYAGLGDDLMNSEKPAGLSELETAQYDLLLEEQAYPFEDSAIDIHEQSASRAREGLYDEWVQKSYQALRELLPGRYDKTEITGEVVRELD